MLTQLHDPEGVTDVLSKGDRFLLPYDYFEKRENELASLFGESFAVQLFALHVGSWQGPLTSAYGVHVVYVKSRSEAWLPTLAEIRERVASAWRAVKAREANETFYQSLHHRDPDLPFECAAPRQPSGAHHGAHARAANDYGVEAR